MNTRRRLVCAASALACGFLFASSAWGVYQQDIKEPADFTAGTFERVSYLPDMGGVGLYKSINCVPYLWVPSPRGNTVSKVDARSGQELACYRMGPEGENWSPCAVTTDRDGNAYVACTVPGLIGKIVRIAASMGTDANGDGQISTCGDGDANGRITPSEVLPWGSDERVGAAMDVGGANGSPTSLVFDPSGYLWVTLWGEPALAKFDLGTRSVVGKVPLVGRPSLVLSGSRQSLWVLSRDAKTLCEVNTITNTLTEFYNLGDCDPAGMVMDDDGKLWIGNGYGGLIGFQPNGAIWSSYDPMSGQGLTGLALDGDGDIWATCPTENKAVRLAAADGSVIAEIPVGVGPQSICEDGDGYMWVLNRGGSTATRIDRTTDKAVLSVATTARPSSSTPFAGCIMKKGIAPSGSWRFTVDSGIRGAGWGRITWDAIEAGGSVKVDVSSAQSSDLVGSGAYVRVINGQRFTVPDGRFLDVRVTIESRGDVTPLLRALRIEGTNHAPDISKAVPSLARILRTDHVMEPVSITGITDVEGDDYTVAITGVTQDEPISGLSAEDKSPDALNLSGSSVWLRGERDLGTEQQPGNGRVYAIAFCATDALGARSAGKVRVVVPTGVLPKDSAVDDGQKFDSLQDTKAETPEKGLTCS